jgi:hypothetical protein
MTLDDALRNGQPDPIAFVLVGPMQTLECIEQAARARHVES